MDIIKINWPKIRIKDTHLAIIKIIFDALVLFIMALTLWKMSDSNLLSKKAILASQVPFISIVNPSFSLSEQKVIITYSITNHSDTPAINFRVNIASPNIPNIDSNYSYKSAILMPHSTKQMAISIPASIAKEIYEFILNGKIPINFIINYEDIFKRKYQITQGCKFINGVLNITDFESKGFEQLLEK